MVTAKAPVWWEGVGLGGPGDVDVPGGIDALVPSVSLNYAEASATEIGAGQDRAAVRAKPRHEHRTRRSLVAGERSDFDGVHPAKTSRAIEGDAESGDSIDAVAARRCWTSECGRRRARLSQCSHGCS